MTHDAQDQLDSLRNSEQQERNAERRERMEDFAEEIDEDIPNAKPILIGILIVIGFALYGMYTLISELTNCGNYYF